MLIKTQLRHVKRALVRCLTPCSRPIRVPIENLLRGGEKLIPAAHYAKLVNAPLRPSTQVTEGPQVALLHQYLTEGDELLRPERFERTAYYQNAAECIDLTGSYFPYVKNPKQILSVAENFIKQYVKNEAVVFPPDSGHSPPNQPICVRPIRYSDCYEIIDGNHRIAAALVRGDSEIEVMPQGDPVLTPVQELLLSVLWQQGRTELYQPVLLPETRTWTLVRRCSDRFEMMQAVLEELDLRTGSYLDIGASYGWFVGQMRQMGMKVFGVERDPIAISVGEMLYGNEPGSVVRSDIVRYLCKEKRSFDVVSCLSMLHHFVLGNGSIHAEDFIKLVDRITRRVLFLDTGQAHEGWFRESLAEWDSNYVRCWLERNTSFRKVVPLGIDHDAVPPYERNYGRTLFACFRE